MSRGALPTVIVGAKTLVREGVVKAIQTGHYKVQVYANMAGFESRSVCRSPALFILLLEETSAVHAAATVAAVRERFPRTRIVTLSIEADPEWSEPLFAAGANGCLPVRISPTTLLMVLDLLALNEDSLRLGTSVTRISEAITLQPSGCETPPRESARRLPLGPAAGRRPSGPWRLVRRLPLNPVTACSDPGAGSLSRPGCPNAS